MNPVEIEEAVSQISSNRFDAVEFPFEFLLAFGRKSTTIKKLRSGITNKSDIGGVLQRNNIHIATCQEGEVDITLNSLKESQETKKGKAKGVGVYNSFNNIFNFCNLSNDIDILISEKDIEITIITLGKIGFKIKYGFYKNNANSFIKKLYNAFGFYMSWWACVMGDINYNQPYFAP